MFDWLESCYKLSPALTAVICWCQLWQLLQAVTSFDSSWMLWQFLQAFPSFDTCWQLLQAVGSYNSPSLPHQHCLNIWFHHSGSIHCRQLWQLLQLLQALQALPDVTSCWQLNLNFISMSTSLRYLIPSTKANSLSPALTAVTAVATFASYARCFKLLAAKPQFHFNVNIA